MNSLLFALDIQGCISRFMGADPLLTTKKCEKEDCFFLRDVLVIWHQVMDLSMLIILWLLESCGS